MPTIFERGLKSFPPQKTYKFHYAYYSEIEDNEINKLHIEVHYFHTQTEVEKTESFDFDFDDYNGSLCEYSPRDNSRLHMPRNIQMSLNNIISSIDSVAGHIREHSKLNGAYLSYFIRDNAENFIYEYDCRVVDIINSSYKLFKQNLSRFIYFTKNDKNLVNILEMLPVVDFDSWYEKATNKYGLVFEQWIFPNDELERLSLFKILFEKISLGQVKFDYRSTRGFSSPIEVHPCDSYDDDVTEITKLFASFARDLRTLLVKSIKTNTP